MEIEELVQTPKPVCSASEFESLYENAFPAFARFAGNRNASFEDAKDIFHDAMVIYYEKSQDPDFAVMVSPEAYVVGIAKNLWLRKYNRDKDRRFLSADEQDFMVPPDFFPDQREVRLLSFLERAGEKCLDLLQRFYFQKMSLKAIASSLGYKTEHSAAVQKYKCIGKVREAIRSKSLHYEDFAS